MILGYSGIVTMKAAVKASQITIEVNTSLPAAVSCFRLSSGGIQSDLLTGVRLL